MPRDRSYPALPEALPVDVVDNHTHLDPGQRVAEEELELAEQLHRSASVGVPQVVQCGCDLPSARWTAEVAIKHPGVLGAIAIHPNEAPVLMACGEYESGFAQIAELAGSHGRIRAIGETGLDYYRTAEPGRAMQIRAFRDHIALAKELNLAMQIHDRDAHEDVMDVLRSDGAPECTVFHCFSGDRAMAQFAASQGWYLSFSGTVTFKNNDGLREALAAVGLGRVMVETDAPYLTPTPFRGRPNAPYLLPYTMSVVADVTGTPLEEACRVVSATSESIYGPW